MDRWLSAIGAVAIVFAVIVSFPEQETVKPASAVKKKIIKAKKTAILPKKAVIKDKEKALIAIVLDDFGYTKKNLNALGQIDAPLTLAVLPKVPYSEKVSFFAKENGFEVILHLPMEPENEKTPLEDGTITSHMSNDQIKRLVAEAFLSVPGATGASNHMGSKATKDVRVMETVLGELKKRGKFFLDSATSAKSVSAEVAKKLNLKHAKRDVFIDNVLEHKYIKNCLKEAEAVAFEKGSAIAIGHDREETVEVLHEIIPEMQNHGIKFVVLSELVKDE